MKVISTNEHYNFNKSLGLSEDITLPCNEEVEVAEEDALILLTYPGVVKAKSDLLDVKESIETPEVKTPFYKGIK
jgi:hypothetical protein